MTNPTSNFGWQMPTPTDLVTDLPADFEVFGQAVDTEFADLLGGTTGQILSKASNTDMDFTWITNDVGDITAVNVTSPITGGGSSGAVTIGVSAASTSASGVVQLSDSTSTTSSVLASTPTATKSAYDLAASAYEPAFTNNFYAGKNKLMNGDFKINQRGFTSNTTTSTFMFDRLTCQISGDGTSTFTAQTFTPGTAPVAGYEGSNYLRVVTAGQTTTAVGTNIAQRVESVRTLAGQTVTLSFWAKAATGTPEIALDYRQNFGTGGSPSATVTTVASQVVISTSWARYSITTAIPSISGKTLGTTTDGFIAPVIWFSAGSDYNTNTGSMGIQNNTFEIWGLQLEAGSTATPFQTASGSLGGELALCQRYYWRNQATGTSSQFSIAAGTSATTAQMTITLPVKMRANANPLEFSTLLLGDNIAAGIAVTNLVIATNSDQTPSVIATVAAGLTANRPYYLGANASANAYIAFSAEL